MLAYEEAAAFGASLQELIDNNQLSLQGAITQAVWHGCLMIGTRQSRPEHEPVVTAQEHWYYESINGCRKKRSFENVPSKVLRATAVADIAIADALWGNFNDKAEQAQCVQSIMGDYSEDKSYRGWRVDPSETLRRRHRVVAYRMCTGLNDYGNQNPILFPQGTGELQEGDKITFQFHPREEVGIKIHARPEFIKAATNPDNPLKGSIDFILDDVDTLADLPETHVYDGSSAWSPAPSHSGTWLFERPQRTIFSLSVIGNRDLRSCNPQDYDKAPLV